ncbi:site-specific integrase [uncultured Alistipes sp.]|uniref:tyrosine-type recombinase/integrase n=1 Tax=uncultured Alistipes sp. TaxID=538949 RepID=UPI0025D5916A|nr:site-specific integrase [uncultured Alistipes sp.]
MPQRVYTGHHPAFAGHSHDMSQFDLVSYFSQQIAAYEQSGRVGSAANYRSACRMLSRFLNGQKLLSNQFTASWLERYERWLIARGIGTNTVVFHIRYLRAIYNHAVDKHLFPDTHINPFQRRSIKQVETRKRALPRKKLKQISDADLTQMHPKYTLARDLFMFSFYTRGMSFVDMAYLRKSDICSQVLTYKRQKTGQILSMHVEPPLQRIINRYNNDSPYVLPILAKDDSYHTYRQQQRELNKFIRKIGTLLNIQEPLTFYVARHSWATLARDCGTPLSVISAGMGHTSERTTRVYLAQLDHSVIDKANRKIISL